MVELNDNYMYKGSGHVGGPGAYGDYTFSGTGVQVYGISAPTITVDGRSHAMGSASVWIDGKEVGTNSVFSKDTAYRFTVIKIDGFPEGTHILHIEPMGGWIDIDYLKTLHTPVPLPEAQAAPGSDLGPVYRLIPRNAQRFCLSPGRDGSLNGASLVLVQVSQDPRQFWHMKSLGGNLDELTPVEDPTLALWIVPPSPTSQTFQALVAPFINRPNQQLLLTPIADGWCKIASETDENIVLSVSDSAIIDGTWVLGNPAKDQPSQQWYPQSVQNTPLGQ